jgi:hypothetical protein
MVRTSDSTLAGNKTLQRMTELMKGIINTRVSNVMNVKAMDTLEMNVPCSSRIKRKE